MGYALTNTRLVHLLDCPACKYGTLDRRTSKDGKRTKLVCADCGHTTGYFIQGGRLYSPAKIRAIIKARR